MDRCTSAGGGDSPGGTSGDLDRLPPSLGGAGALGPSLTATAWFRCCPGAARDWVVLELLRWWPSDPDRDTSAAQLSNPLLTHLEPNQCEWRKSLHGQANP